MRWSGIHKRRRGHNTIQVVMGSAICRGCPAHRCRMHSVVVHRGSDHQLWATRRPRRALACVPPQSTMHRWYIKMMRGQIPVPKLALRPHGCNMHTHTRTHTHAHTHTHTHTCAWWLLRGRNLDEEEGAQAVYHARSRCVNHTGPLASGLDRVHENYLTPPTETFGKRGVI